MNYLFLTKLIPENLKDEVSRNSSNTMQDAANALQFHLYNGLTHNLNKNIKIVNVLPIDSFPQYYKEPFIKKSYFETEKYAENVNLGFCNVKLIKNYSYMNAVKKELVLWCSESEENRFVFMYTLSSPFLQAVKKVKKKYPDLKVCGICADLPSMVSLSSNKSFIKKAYEKYRSNKAYNNLDVVDYFVLLTREMADYMKIKKPFCVVEGISTKPEKDPEFNFSNAEKKKTILYTGTLHKRFGVIDLVNAFSSIGDENISLVICGIGDSDEEIRKRAEKDKRICFLGKVTREEAMHLQRDATVLVNPRPNNEEFTKYSFPSKNLEYLSSGKPLVAHKLDGIPDEYDELIYYPTGNSQNELKEALVNVLNKPSDELEKHCRKVYEYVQNNKNEINQTKKIIKMLFEERQ